jgi:hypothetical protein
MSGETLPSSRACRTYYKGPYSTSAEQQFRPILHDKHLRTPALTAGALLDNVIEKIVWNQCERQRADRSLGRM